MLLKTEHIRDENCARSTHSFRFWCFFSIIYIRFQLRFRRERWDVIDGLLWFVILWKILGFYRKFWLFLLGKVDSTFGHTNNFRLTFLGICLKVPSQNCRQNICTKLDDGKTQIFFYFYSQNTHGFYWNRLLLQLLLKLKNSSDSQMKIVISLFCTKTNKQRHTIDEWISKRRFGVFFPVARYDDWTSSEQKLNSNWSFTVHSTRFYGFSMWESDDATENLSRIFSSKPTGWWDVLLHG